MLGNEVEVITVTTSRSRAARPQWISRTGRRVHLAAPRLPPEGHVDPMVVARKVVGPVCAQLRKPPLNRAARTPR